METLDADALLATIETLPSGEQRRLFDQLAYKQSNTKRKAEFSPDEKHVIEAMHHVCRGRPGSVEGSVKNYGRRKFADDVEYVLHYIRKAAGSRLRREHEQALLNVIMRCLAQQLERRGLMVSPNLLLNNLDYLEHAVDQQFPGYADARMLHRVAMAAAVR